jgi:hypothetical protein
MAVRRDCLAQHRSDQDNLLRATINHLKPLILLEKSILASIASYQRTACHGLLKSATITTSAARDSMLR